MEHRALHRLLPFRLRLCVLLLCLLSNWIGLDWETSDIREGEKHTGFKEASSAGENEHIPTLFDLFSSAAAAAIDPSTIPA